MKYEKLWHMYKSSEDGKNMIAAFDPSNENFWDNILEAVDKIQKNVKAEDITKHISTQTLLIEANMPAAIETITKDATGWTREIFEKFILNLEVRDIEEDKDGQLFTTDTIFVKKGDLRRKASLMTAISIVLYFNYDIFKPILLPSRFDYLQKCCDVLGIDLPPIPRSKDYKNYLLFYYDICESWNEFQQENNLTDAEFCAYIYGFAPQCLEESKPTDLPRPTNVWLTGADKSDFEYLDKLGQDTEYNQENIWACNERTRRGDIIVIYCTTPRSYIHSIWRANSGGIFNPFDYYHCRTTVCDGIKTPQITFHDLKQDSYFSNIPIVRKNLQGVNGIELSAQDYSELFRLIEEKGGSTEALPKLFEGLGVEFGEIRLEKDVEENILIPFLKNLGYSDDDWNRQLSQKAGRGLKAIPDFVFFPKGEKGINYAPMVIEAKLDMSSMIEQQKAFRQALSYANMLRCKIMGICDKERLVIYNVSDNGTADYNNPIFESHWQAIYSDQIVGATLNAIIGKEVIKSLI